MMVWQMIGIALGFFVCILILAWLWRTYSDFVNAVIGRVSAWFRSEE